MMKTIHLIFNAHIDPIWLWPWQAGLDSVLATCRSACDRLDAHPDLTFSRGEAWSYDQVERVDPALFARIRRHVESGRWAIVGGWWIQPDCNQPSGFALRKQIELGKRYFTQRFGQFPRVAYNVDSFGHGAGLPALMREAGQEFYVMMRPQEHERKLPARLFRWRGVEGGPEVVTFRIAGAYTTWGPSARASLEACITELPEGIDHTMCFLGVGDHGGGPAEDQIAWLREHWNDLPGCQLQFSTPQRFFDAVVPQIDKLPLVTGELQYHAIGCYSVYRPVKVNLRKAEHAVQQAEVALAHDPRPDPQAAAGLEAAWEQVVFHQFHDTLGGTCIPSAYAMVEAQLGSARSAADRTIQYSLRRRMNALPDDPLQRIVLLNASDRAFDGYTEIEPWLERRRWQAGWKLLDEQGRPVPFQRITSEAVVDHMLRLLVRVNVAPGEIRVLRIDDSAGEAAAPSRPLQATIDSAESDPVAVHLGRRSLRLGDWTVPLPRLDLIGDLTDTWSHGIDRYGEVPVATAGWTPPSLVEIGPAMASLVQTATFGQSWALAEYRVYAGEPFVELKLRVHWAEQHKVLKLVLPLDGQAVGRRDGVLGTAIDRALDGAERPLRDWTMLWRGDGATIGVTAPEVYALDVTPERARFTLLRSPRMAWHDPSRRNDPRDRYADPGEHEFRFRFYGLRQRDDRYLDDQALLLQRPLVMADLTRGMPARIS